VVAEAAFLTAELHPRQHVPPALLVPRALRVGGLALAGFAVGVAALGAATVDTGGSHAVEALGAAAALAVAGVLWAASRPRR